MTKRDDEEMPIGEVASDNLTSWPVGEVLTPSGWVPQVEWEELLAKLPKRTMISTRFEDEAEAGKFSYEYGVEGDPDARLGYLTARLWLDYLIRNGHMRRIPTVDASAPEPGWDFYRVYLRDDPTNTPLDISKTLAELGLTERRYWVRFERAL